MRVLMVCLGNICRSPLAEGILQKKISEKKLNWEVDSAGTGSWHIGEQPDARSIAVARQFGIDITGQRARQIRAFDLDQFDLILAMDASNFQDILRLAKNNQQRQKVHLIMNFVREGANQGIPDPYWDDDGFEKVYQMLDQACEQIINKFASLRE